ncbi:unnamed protein product [Paramecium primaurelia]|uniref:Uncharacterized protein n=1 Tax=Paramecium primaurelia TaxID=5886 RepID=A0A8S1MS22_PARPR|nr:unnamed protein product [Paramecium primaurelia]
MCCTLQMLKETLLRFNKRMEEILIIYTKKSEKFKLHTNLNSKKQSIGFQIFSNEKIWKIFLVSQQREI